MYNPHLPDRPTSSLEKSASLGKTYSKGFKDGMMPERLPIHVQAKMELEPEKNPSVDLMVPQSRYNNYDSAQLTKKPSMEEKDSEKYRLRPETPKLNMINLRKKQTQLKKLNLDAKKRLPKLENLDQNRVPTVKKSTIAKVMKVKKKSPERVMNMNDFAKMASSGMPMPPPMDSSDEEEETKEEEEEEEEVIEEELTLPGGGQNVLFGEAYEERFIDIIENEDYDGAIDLDQKLLEQSLGMPVEELEKLEKVQIQVDTSSSHLQTVGETLTSLKFLNLNDSIIHSIRDLGTAFRNIQVLQISRCELTDLSGIVALDNLRELYCSYNEVTDIYDITYLEKLEVLDLEANKIEDFQNITYLQTNTELTDLTIEWNPMAMEKNFRKRVSRVLPQLKQLDGLDVKALRSVPKDKTDISDRYDVESKVISENVMMRFIHLWPNLGEMEEVAKEALEGFQKEDSDEHLIINAIKSAEYKKFAFEKKGDFDYSEFDDTRSMASTARSNFFSADEKAESDDDGMDFQFRSSL